jgi:cardiolipin synthase A/B
MESERQHQVNNFFERYFMLKERHLQPQLDEIWVGDNSLQLYSDGYELYTAMLATIDEAKEGVEVYVMCGNPGKQELSSTFGSFPAGVHIMRTMPFRRPWHVLDPRRYVPDHRNLLVADGWLGFIGSYNLGNTYHDTLHDMHLCLRGPATADLAYAFIANWNRFSSPQDQITRRYTRQFDPFINIQANDALRLTFPIRDMYLEAIDRAEQTILLTNASFVPDHNMLKALTAAVTRGVDVRMLVPWPTRHILAEQMICSSFTQCLQAGIRLYISRQRRLRSNTCTIDGQWSTVGSAHLDLLSSVVNYELNMEIYDVAFASQIQYLFESDIADAYELTLQKWLSRPWYSKLSERMLTPLRFLLY